MSRTNKTLDVQKNPCQHWMQWDSGNGCWKAYDKETKQNISYPSDTRFICLDALSTVTGFSDAFQKGYYGNEVRNVGKDIIRAMCDGKEVAKGIWRDIKIQVRDIKFATSVYVMAKLGNDYQLANLRLSGAAVTGWIEFTKSVGGISALFGDVVVTVTEVTQEKKGSVNYTVPHFSIVSRTLTPEAAAKADELDTQLQQFLEQYLKGGASPSASPEDNMIQEFKASCSAAGIPPNVTQEIIQKVGSDGSSMTEDQMNQGFALMDSIPF